MRDKTCDLALPPSRSGMGLPTSILAALLIASLSANAWSATVDVRAKGALGDGKNDDTAAIQSAIDSLGASGGTVTVPAGHYMIDATHAINLHSNISLKMADGAVLAAIPNSAARYHVVKVWNAQNVQISGGSILGERDGHQGTGGEWGYGLNISGSHNVTVSNLHVSDCWGDGVLIGSIGSAATGVVSTQVTLDHVVSTHNRRQGLTIGPANGVQVIDSTFSNSQGTKPESGIDIEPQTQGPAQNITIVGSIIEGNHGSGMEMHDNAIGVTIKNSTFRNNQGYGLLSVNARQLTINTNLFTGNGLVGFAVGGTTDDAKITANTFSGNSSRYLRRVATLATKSDADHATEFRIDKDTRKVVASGNTFNP